MPKGPLTLRDLLKKLKKYGIVARYRRGKGSEIILLKPSAPGSTQGPQYPIKNHGPGTLIKLPVVLAALRRFNIDPTEFWG